MRPGGGLQRLTTPEEGIAAIHEFLERAETVRGKPTIESFRGWYCYASYNTSHICPEWEPQVLKIKAEVENL